MTTSGIGRRRAAAQKDAKVNPAYLKRRQEIIEAAARVFKRQGYGGTSLGDVAAELDTDRANLYYYVSSKHELFEAGVSDAVRANLARARAVHDGDGTPHAKLRTIIEELMLSYAEFYPFLYVYIQENLSHVDEGSSEWAAEMRAINTAYQEIVVAIVQQGYDEGSLRDVGPAWVVGYGVIGTVGWTNRWFDPDRSAADAVTIGRAYADMLLGGLTAS